MDYPTYNGNDLHTAHQDGELTITDFNEFLETLKERNAFNDSTEKGIVERVLSEGTAGLTPKQKYRLDEFIRPYSDVECKMCGDELSWMEKLEVYDEGYCSRCSHMIDND